MSPESLIYCTCPKPPGIVTEVKFKDHVPYCIKCGGVCIPCPPIERPAVSSTLIGCREAWLNEGLPEDSKKSFVLYDSYCRGWEASSKAQQREIKVDIEKVARRIGCLDNTIFKNTPENCLIIAKYALDMAGLEYSEPKREMVAPPPSGMTAMMQKLVNNGLIEHPAFDKSEEIEVQK